MQAVDPPTILVVDDDDKIRGLPGMSGWAVAAAVNARYPGVAIGLVTGWGEQVDPQQAARHHLKFVLAKPFMVNDVLTAVSAALDGAERG